MARIMVVGSGVVGKATGKGFLDNGHKVTFVDIAEKILNHLEGEGYQALHLQEMDLEETDIVFVSVSTPTVDGHIVLDHLISALSIIGKALGRAIEESSQKYRVVVIRSTIPPGTTEELVIPLLEKNSEKSAGQDFGVCTNPEYLREKEAERDFTHPWIIVIGENDPRAGKILEELYRPFGCSIYRVPIRVAEFQKYVHNLFNATKISFFNEMRLVAKTLGIDASQVFRLVIESAEGMWHPAYGTRNLGPFGGSCLPKDTQAFLSFAKEHNIEMLLLKAVIEVNEIMKRRQKFKSNL